MKLDTVAIVTKPRQAEVAQVARNVVDWFKTRGLRSYIDADAASLMGLPELGMELEQLALCADLVVVIGGDGTLLSAARSFGDRRIPILAVNHGGLGFLTSVALDDMFPALERVLAGTFVRQKLMTADVRVHRGDAEVARYRALNDAIINKGSLARIIALETHVNGHYVTTFRADGLILSTPAGSTAYNMSAGGPIVHPDFSAMILTPICPHTLTNRPIVLPPDATIDVRLLSRDEVVYVTVDGQVGMEIQTGDVVRVQRSAVEIELVFAGEPRYFDVLRGKLKWG